jgi:hypothetical protein
VIHIGIKVPPWTIRSAAAYRRNASSQQGDGRSNHKGTGLGFQAY